MRRLQCSHEVHRVARRALCACDAVEREAAERYAEFAARMQDEGRDDLARLFGMLARAEQEHLEALERRCEGMALPKIVDARYQWLDAYAPETVARELIFRLMTPRHAL